MNKLPFLFLFLLIAMLPLGSLQAQDDGVIVLGHIGTIDDLGPIDAVTCSGRDACAVAGLLFPRFLGTDPVTGNFAPGAPGNSLVEDWHVSEDGLVYTFTMRSDRVWSDGLPVTADDVLFTFDTWDEVFWSIVDDVSAPDRFTVRVQYSEHACDEALHNWDIRILPAHAFDNDPDAVQDHPFNRAPSVTSGPFRFGERTADRLILIADDRYANGAVQSSALHVVGTQDVEEQRERFLNGEIHYISGKAHEMRDIVGIPGIQSTSFPGREWSYIGLNLADPRNPQSGYDQDGNRIDQDPHPILADLQVRRALQHGLNVPEIIDQAVSGEATQMASYAIPLAWTEHPGLAPVAYDPQKAERLLDTAGWVMGENGIRVADGALYAHDGSELRFTLLTSENNPVRLASAEVVRDQLAEIGVVVDIEVTGISTVLDIMIGQTHDAVLMSWYDSFPAEATLLFFKSDGDSLEGWFNYSSYANPRLDALSDAAITAPHCDLYQRTELSHTAQQVIQHDQPYLFLYSVNMLYAAHGIEGFAPYPNMPFWNIEAWRSTVNQ